MTTDQTNHHLSDADEAFELLMRNLAGFGSSLSAEHAAGLLRLQQCYFDTAAGRTAGRTAWPLAVGSGKTESVAAFAAVACRRPVSMMVAQNTIEALCKLKRRMLALGVPESMIGLLHSKRFDEKHRADCMTLNGPPGYASEPSIKDSPSTYPILLLSHEMLKTREDIHEFNQYEGSERGLVIWDESLMKSSGRTMDLTELASAYGAIKPYVDAKPESSASGALKFVDYCAAELRQHLKVHNAGTIRLPEKTADVIDEWTNALRSLTWRKPQDCKTLTSFLQLTQEPLRIVELKNTAVIRYELMIPESLRRIVVLDASYNIRELVRTYDQSIDVIDDYVQVKRFNTVSVAQMSHGGGRSTVDAALRGRNSGLLKALIERIEGYPADQGVLIFTYMQRPKEKGASHAEIIRDGLERAGIDTSARLPNGKTRIAWLHWGQELGLSDYAYCENVLCVGIYRKSHEQYAAEMIGQLGDLEAPQASDPGLVRQVEISEVFHAMYQAAGRGSCRITDRGTARPMRLDFIGIEDFPDEYWNEALPGASRTSWTSKHLESSRLAKPAAEIIVGYLESRRGEVEQVSSRALSRAILARLGVKLNPKTLQRARRLADERLEGWAYRRATRGYVRSPFTFR